MTVYSYPDAGPAVARRARHQFHAATSILYMQGSSGNDLFGEMKVNKQLATSTTAVRGTAAIYPNDLKFDHQKRIHSKGDTVLKNKINKLNRMINKSEKKFFLSSSFIVLNKKII